MSLSILKQQYNSIKDSLSCLVNDSNYAQFDSHKNMLTTMASIENRSIAVYDLHKKAFLVKQDAHIALLGYKTDGADHDNIEKFIEKIHPDDIEFFYQTGIIGHEFFHSLPSAEKKSHKLIYDFRIRSKSGQYFRFMHQLLVLECDISQNSWLLLVIIDLISDHATARDPRRYVMDIRTRKISLFEKEVAKKQLITKREREILELLVQGFDSESISERLFISVNTVNNHRQNILSKTGTVNTMQTLLFAKRIGLI